MAIAGDTNLITGNQCVLTTLLAAAAGTTKIILVNESGAPVDIFVGSETDARQQLEGFGAPVVLSGDEATLALKGICYLRPLRVRVTAYTA